MWAVKRKFNTTTKNEFVMSEVSTVKNVKTIPSEFRAKNNNYKILKRC